MKEKETKFNTIKTILLMLTKIINYIYIIIILIWDGDLYCDL